MIPNGLFLYLIARSQANAIAVPSTRRRSEASSGKGQAGDAWHGRGESWLSVGATSDFSETFVDSSHHRFLVRTLPFVRLVKPGLPAKFDIASRIDQGQGSELDATRALFSRRLATTYGVVCRAGAVGGKFLARDLL